jgi:hypothetical protein
MSVRLNAEGARKASKQAKAELEKKKSVAEQRERLAESRLIEQQLHWDEQKNILIGAACSGDFDCTTSQLYHPRILRAHGFQISVVQVIAKKMSDVSFDKEKVKRFDKFISSIEDDFEKYYESTKDMRDSLWDALDECMDFEYLSDAKWVQFRGDHIYEKVIPEELKRKYQSYLMSINSLILGRFRVYERFEYEGESLLPNATYKIEEVVPLRKFYDFDEIYVVSESNNKFLVSWRYPPEQEDGSVDGLFDYETLHWLAGAKGQEVLDQIFRKIATEVEEGNQQTELLFSFFNDRWHVKCGLQHGCISPVFFENYLIAQGYKVKKIKDSGEQVQLRIGW